MRGQEKLEGGKGLRSRSQKNVRSMIEEGDMKRTGREKRKLLCLKKLGKLNPSSDKRQGKKSHRNKD